MIIKNRCFTNNRLKRNMTNGLSTVITRLKRHLPAISDMNDREEHFLISRCMNADERTILEKRNALNVDSLSDTLALGNLELPEGWGDLLVSLANPLMTGIQSGMLTPEMLDLATDPLLFKDPYTKFYVRS